MADQYPSPAPVVPQSATNIPPPSTHHPGAPDSSPQSSPVYQEPEENIYTASYSSILFRNLLAGAARAVGGIIIYLLFITVVAWVFSNFILPQLQPILKTFESLGSLPQNQIDTQALPPQYQNLLDKFSQEPGR